MRVLVVNPGSATLKAALVEDGRLVESTNVTAAEGEVELPEVVRKWDPVDAVGVRVVHGGSLTAPTVVTDAVVDELEDAVSLAPLHNPPALAAIRAVRCAHPSLPVVACFDTAFHATLSPAAYTYALPAVWNERWGLRRYGFHGLSHAYASGRAASLVGRPVESLRIVVCHLGGGASLCAVAGGVSVDTTMGFTPLEGLVMQVRSGSVDPGLLLWLQTEAGLTAAELTEMLEHHSGLAGLSGTSGDMREVVSGVRSGDPACTLALDVYVHRLVRSVGAMAASAGGLDVLVFTGGVGEHQALVRARVCAALGHLGVVLDESLNADCSGDGVIGRAGSAAVVVVEAREDLQVAAGVVEALG